MSVSEGVAVSPRLPHLPVSTDSLVSQGQGLVSEWTGGAAGTTGQGQGSGSGICTFSGTLFAH